MRTMPFRVQKLKSFPGSKMDADNNTIHDCFYKIYLTILLSKIDNTGVIIHAKKCILTYS